LEKVPIDLLHGEPVTCVHCGKRSYTPVVIFMRDQFGTPIEARFPKVVQCAFCSAVIDVPEKGIADV
jgi:hypothetical protein